MKTPEEIRETVRQRYAAAATQLAVVDLQRDPASEASCCGGGCAETTDEQAVVSATSCCGGGCAETTDAQGGATEASCCGSAPVGTTDAKGRVVFGSELYGLGAAEGGTQTILT